MYQYNIQKASHFNQRKCPQGPMVPISIWSSIAKWETSHFWFLFQCGAKLHNREPATSVV